MPSYNPLFHQLRWHACILNASKRPGTYFTLLLVRLLILASLAICLWRCESHTTSPFRGSTHGCEDLRHPMLSTCTPKNAQRIQRSLALHNSQTVLPGARSPRRKPHLKDATLHPCHSVFTPPTLQGLTPLGHPWESHCTCMAPCKHPPLHKILRIRSRTVHSQGLAVLVKKVRGRARSMYT
jgi:hypothetical protein